MEGKSQECEGNIHGTKNDEVTDPSKKRKPTFSPGTEKPKSNDWSTSTRMSLLQSMAKVCSHMPLGLTTEL
jgi:hypothetical protein